ncbi:amidase family protein [Dokdonia sp. Asnod1-B02]|uniref:amidase family protein n=1 Tax=Dokdonia sp. Asnod1-B02 TaxID=3160573 RepID=UPI0038661696
MKYLYTLALATALFSCKNDAPTTTIDTTPRYVWEAYNDSLDIAKTQALENSRMHLKLVNAKGLDKNDIWKDLNGEINTLSRKRISEISPLIIEQDIPTIQKHIKNGDYSYEELTLFYLNRIARFESDNDLALNGVISLNKEAVQEARALDNKDKSTIDEYSVYGMPILLKDNIGAAGMITTAGSVALADNNAGDAFITKRLKEENAIILGKANLSEWAYFLCTGCPVGYSAVGGQTINPYGRLQFESGGSSSGSGVSVAANYAVAAIGSETSGSILSPSSQNNLVGLKPTIGLLSRSGIVPISSHLDTPGPMTKNVVDNAILLQALTGKDTADAYSYTSSGNYVQAVKEGNLEGKYLGVIKGYLQDSTYAAAIDKLKQTKATLVEVDMERVNMPGFLSILNIDMKIDLPAYYDAEVASSVKNRNIEELITFNNQDSLTRIPYGQQLFKGIVADSTTAVELKAIKENLMEVTQAYFQDALSKHPEAGGQLDAILSINNYDAGYAAAAHYPALTIPMGFTAQGEPKGITIITPSKQEEVIYNIAVGVESTLKARTLPEGYQE